MEKRKEVKLLYIYFTKTSLSNIIINVLNKGLRSQSEPQHFSFVGLQNATAITTASITFFYNCLQL